MAAAGILQADFALAAVLALLALGVRPVRAVAAKVGVTGVEVVIEPLTIVGYRLTLSGSADGVAHPLGQVDAQPHIVPGEVRHVAGTDAGQVVGLAPVDVGPHRVHGTLVLAQHIGSPHVR